MFSSSHALCQDILEVQLIAPPLTFPSSPLIYVFGNRLDLMYPYVIKFIIVIEHVGQQKELATQSMTYEHDLRLSFNVYL